MTFIKKWWKQLAGLFVISAALAAGELDGPTLALNIADRVVDGYEKVCVERATGKQIGLPLTAQEYAKNPMWVPPGYEKCLYARQYARFATTDGKLADMTYGDIGGGKWEVVYKGKTFIVDQSAEKVIQQIDVLDGKTTTSTK